MAINLRKNAIGNYIFLNPDNYILNQAPRLVNNFDDQSLYMNFQKSKADLNRIVTFKASEQEKKNAKYIEEVMNGLLGTKTMLDPLGKELEEKREAFWNNLIAAISEDFNNRLRSSTGDNSAGVTINKNLSVTYEQNYKKNLQKAQEVLQKAIMINNQNIQLDNMSAKNITTMLSNLAKRLNSPDFSTDKILKVKTELSQLYTIVKRTMGQKETSASQDKKTRTFKVTESMLDELKELENILGNFEEIDTDIDIRTSLGTFLVNCFKKEIRIPSIYIGDVLEYAAAVASAEALNEGKTLSKDAMMEIIKRNVKGRERSQPGLIQSRFAMDFTPNKNEELIQLNNGSNSAILSTTASQNKIDIAFDLPKGGIANISAKNLDISTHTNFHIVSGTHLFNLVQAIPMITNHWINLLNAKREDSFFNRDMGLFLIAKGLKGDVVKFKNGHLAIESANYLMINDTSGTQGIVTRPISLILEQLETDKILQYTQKIRSKICQKLESFSTEAIPDEQELQKRLHDVLITLKNIEVDISLNTKDVYNTKLY